MSAQIDGEISINELLTLLYDAKERMSVNNGHRPILVHAMSAIMQLTQRLENAESKILDLQKQITDKPRVEIASAVPVLVVQ